MSTLLNHLNVEINWKWAETLHVLLISIYPLFSFDSQLSSSIIRWHTTLTQSVSSLHSVCPDYQYDLMYNCMCGNHALILWIEGWGERVKEPWLFRKRILYFCLSVFQPVQNGVQCMRCAVVTVCVCGWLCRYDHLRKEASDAKPANVDKIAEPWRAALESSFTDYVRSHYNEVGSVTVYGSSTAEGNITLTACIESHKFSPKNFWYAVPLFWNTVVSK